MKSSNQIPDEFDTNLELLKIANKVHHRELNRDTRIYSCNLHYVRNSNQRQRSETRANAIIFNLEK
jgi:hypothetical protein